MSFSEQFLKLEGTAREFVSTHWSIVLQAGKADSPQSAAALEKLCQAYWYPLYSYARRQGHCPQEGADLTQDFFSHLLSTDALSSVNREKGKFRSFLIASFKNLLANDWHRSRRQKRGGGMQIFSLDEEIAEGRYQLEAINDLTPDKIFDRRWAETILSRALERLREECDSGEKSRRFDGVKNFLIGEQGTDSLAEAAAKLNMSLGALKGLVHRLRRRFRDLIRDEIAQTVSTPEEIDQEIRDLFTAFCS